MSSFPLGFSSLSWLCRTVLAYSAAPCKEAPPHPWVSSNSHTFTLTTSSSKAGWTVGSYSYIEALLVFLLSFPTDPNAASTFILTIANSPAPCSSGTGCDDSSSPRGHCQLRIISSPSERRSTSPCVRPYFLTDCHLC